MSLLWIYYMLGLLYGYRGRLKFSDYLWALLWGWIIIPTVIIMAVVGVIIWRRK